MRNWFKQQIAEIQSSRELQLYGFFLGCTHLITIVFWNFGARIFTHLNDPIAVCWQFWPQCYQARPYFSAIIEPLFGIFIFASLMGTLLWRVHVRTAYWSLFGATLLKLILYFLDYREMGNYHYMPHLVLIVFLLVPNKITCIRLLIAAFYFGAGLIKFNREWLSGAAIFGAPFLRGMWLALGCFAALFLEMIGSFALLSQRKAVWMGALGAFAIFHLFSWHLVGYFYPLIMFCLLSIYWLTRNADKLDASQLLRGLAPRTSYAVLGIFLLMQMPPLLSHTDSALTGEGRLTSLNMFDARIRCHSHIWVRKMENGVPTLVDMNNVAEGRGTRIHCEPWYYESYAQSLCRLNAQDPDFQNIDIDLVAKRTSDREFQTLIHKQNVCNAPPQRGH